MALETTSVKRMYLKEAMEVAKAAAGSSTNYAAEDLARIVEGVYKKALELDPENEK